ncbi:expressed unknown protein [Seminavis robusta]|uniref:Uncharacterized protein n=1 Tax=Seminavis robusta TaxID=568900 RepID=A0A9N8ETY5_9STRA|nr:expressed unknown protein [Seminavis robusta]|eukprot:Sro1809_g299100.1 n/a (150) ;mRNA; f:20242-20691
MKSITKTIVLLLSAVALTSASPCRSNTSCNSCLNDSANCAWFDGACEADCFAIADASCYAPSNFPQLDSQQICWLYQTDKTNEARCSKPTNCGDCTTTQKVDDSGACTWYTGAHGGWCGAGGCTWGGKCGVSKPEGCRAHRALGNGLVL